MVVTSINIVSAQEWQTDFKNAKKIALEENKPIIMVFQGSDWCAPCIKLNKEVWSTEVFKTYAKDHYVMIRVDFPRRKENKLSAEQTEANAQLAEKYNPGGFFPFVAVLDTTGKKIGETGYKKTTPENYIKELNSFIK